MDENSGNNSGAPKTPAEGETVGMRLRAIRINHCLPVNKLARLSGLSINTLTRIENNEISPSIAALQQLARALEVPITAFFEAEPEPKRVVYTSRFKRGDAQVERARIENLSEGLAGNAVQPFVVTLEPHADSGTQMVVHPGYEFVYVLCGRIMYVIDNKPYLLDPSDSLVFESHLPHRWKNVGEGEAQIILVLTPIGPGEESGGQHFGRTAQ